MVEVLGRLTSINVRKVLWALDELGESFQRQDWGLPLRDTNVPEFLALNPNGLVPVLIEDDGTVLWESNGILVYLAQTRGALLPTKRQALGLSLQWLGWQASELNPQWSYAMMALLRKDPRYTDPDRIAQSIAGWTKKMVLLEAELAKGRPFIAGEDFSIADIALGLSCHRWFMTPFDKPDLSATRDYYERLRERSAGARWMPAEIG